MTSGEDGRKTLRTIWRRVYRMRALVGIAAGLVSVGGFLYSFLMPATPKPAYGDLVAIVQDVKTKKPVPDAVEIMTEADAVITTVSADVEGRARRRVKEGGYKLRVTHPRFGAETRKVHVLAGETAEIRVAMSPRPGGSSPAPPSAGQTVDQGVSSVKKFFRGLTK